MTKPKIWTCDSIHTNLHDVDLDMACQQELEKREQLLPDKNSSTEIDSWIDDRKERNM